MVKKFLRSWKVSDFFRLNNENASKAGEDYFFSFFNHNPN